MSAPFPSPLRHAARGYTAVEVLMAMTVMVIGAAAVISMQKTSVTGNLDARQTDIANGIGRAWMERIERDAMQWTCPGPACPSTANTPWTALVVNPTSTITGKWFLPKQYLGTTNPETMSPGFDILGRDLPLAQLAPDSVSGWPGATFCVNVRLSWLVAQSLPIEPGLVRADVRVLWPRGIGNGTPSAGFCTDAIGALDDPETGVTASEHPFFHTLYMTTSVRESPAQ